MIALAEAAARASGAIMRQAHLSMTSRQLRRKGAVDLVTETDLACERAICDLLRHESPGVPILGEEGEGGLAAPLPTCWIVDPLDGTTNFVHGFPAFGVSVAYREEGRVLAGCVYDPLHEECYTARLGGGAHCNGRRLRVSATPELGDALLITGFGYDRQQRAAWYLAYVEAFLRRCQGLRRVGAAALDLAHLAAGQADGFWEFGLKPWDVAAGALLVSEAGGRVTGTEGQAMDLQEGRILATNGQLHQSMLEVLAEVNGLQGSRIVDMVGEEHG